MKTIIGRFATTHIDRHGDRMMLSALEAWVESASRQYVPVTINHDPRKPPIGRIVSGRIVQLEDGEYAVEGEIQVFEPDDPPPGDWLGDRSIPLHTHTPGKLELGYDRNYEDEKDQVLIEEISDIFGTRPRYDIKKALDPISILTIGGIFLLSHVASGFLTQLGSDGYKIFKNKIKALATTRKQDEKEKLLRFDLDLESGTEIINVQIILTNPSHEEIDRFLSRGLSDLQNLMPTFYNRTLGIKRVVLEYEDEDIKFRYALRQDGIVMNSKDLLDK